MNKAAKLLIIACVLLSFFSCEKNTADVYIAGYYYDDNDYNYKACYWKNGVKTDLSANGSKNSTASAITVAEGDIYIAGYYQVKGDLFSISPVINRPCYWKNGVIIDLPISGSASSAEAIAVAGSDVYIAGWDNHKACYWKNGELIDLHPADLGTKKSYFEDLTVDELIEKIDDMSLGEFFGFLNALSWLSNDQDMSHNRTSSYANAIVVMGDDVYVSGGFEGIACYWKNGEMTDLSIEDSPRGIAVAGGDIYILGEDCYWKNGKRINLRKNRNAEYSFVAIAVENRKQKSEIRNRQ